MKGERDFVGYRLDFIVFYSILTTQYSVPLLVLLDLTPCFCKILPNTLTLFPEIGSLLCF